MVEGKKPAFGGYSISFKGCSDTVESVFGSSPASVALSACVQSPKRVDRPLSGSTQRGRRSGTESDCSSYRCAEREALEVVQS
jgi:hypothetical protein